MLGNSVHGTRKGDWHFAGDCPAVWFSSAQQRGGPAAAAAFSGQASPRLQGGRAFAAGGGSSLRTSLSVSLPTFSPEIVPPASWRHLPPRPRAAALLLPLQRRRRRGMLGRATRTEVRRGRRRRLQGIASCHPPRAPVSRRCRRCALRWREGGQTRYRYHGGQPAA